MDSQRKPDYSAQRLIKYRMFLINEAKGLLTRLSQLQPFETSMPMVVSANIPMEAQKSIYQLMQKGALTLNQRIKLFIQRMKTDLSPSIEKCQQIYTLLKLHFNALLDQFDIFADVVSQRSEHNTGIWIAGLDELAKDALIIEGEYYQKPPVICYLDRGHGAAIRRVRTRLPGGKSNPVAIIKIPRERMVASGIASSLVHEIGHQGSALLDLITLVKPMLKEMMEHDKAHSREWKLFLRWISEILADLWSVGMLGIGATTGLISVVSLPKYFVYRVSHDGPHPFPWIRVKISLAFGRALYPDDQWDRLERFWEVLYPKTGLKSEMLELIEKLQKVIPLLVELVLNFRPLTLKGKKIRDIFPVKKHQPSRLRFLYHEWIRNANLMNKLRPTLVFAIVSQARADNQASPALECKLLSKMLRKWALENI